LDLLIALLLFSGVLLNQPKLIKNFVNKVIGGVILAVVIDIVWLSLYTKQWWITTYQDSFSLLYIRRAMVVLSYIIMVLRIFVLIILIISYNDYSAGEDEFETEADHHQSPQVFSQY